MFFKVDSLIDYFLHRKAQERGTPFIIRERFTGDGFKPSNKGLMRNVTTKPTAFLNINKPYVKI